MGQMYKQAFLPMIQKLQKPQFGYLNCCAQVPHKNNLESCLKHDEWHFNKLEISNIKIFSIENSQHK